MRKALAIAVVVGAALAAVNGGAQPSRYLYLLAGTPIQNAPDLKYPVTLYAVNPKGELETVRQIFSKSQSLTDVRDDMEGRLYVVTDDFGALSIIHERDPERNDAVKPEFSGAVTGGVTQSAWGIIAPRGQGSSAVFPEMIMKEVGTTPQGYKSYGFGGWKIHLIAGNSRVTPRISEGQWNLYRWFRYNGSPVAPVSEIIRPAGNIVNSQIVVPISGAPPPGEQIVKGKLVSAPVVQRAIGTFGPIPPDLPASVGMQIETTSDAWGTVTYPIRTVAIVADMPRFFAFSGHSTDSKQWPVPVYVLDRATRHWKVVDCPFVGLWPRVFGSWIATTDEEPNPTGRPSPGLENERNLPPYANVTGNFPQVRGMYGTKTYIPGKLVLENLVDGRKVTIDTGQQDSEVLDLGEDGSVLYRVNNEVFSVRIAADKIGPATLVVKGEDVPEVHWVFWSEAKPPVQVPNTGGWPR